MPPPSHYIQPTFAGGEFTPSLHARVDIAKYLTGLRRARNVNIMPQGGVRNRPGTKMVSAAYNSASAVRLIPFIVSKTQAYIIELGNFYARFYTQDAQVQMVGAAGWVTATAYAVGNYVTQGGVQYYCLIAHTSGTFATDLANGDWVAMNAYQISTPWAAADLANLKFAQSAAVMYFAHSSYAPQQLTFVSSANWSLSAYSFINGPFMLQNTDTSFTITPSAISGNGITLTASKALFDTSSPSQHINALFELIWTVVGQTITPNITTSVLNWIPTKTTWQAVTTGTWSGTILIQTSPDNITWTTVATVTSNGTVSGTASFTDGYLRAVMQSAVAFSGTATVVLTGNGDATAATNLAALNASTINVPAGDTAKITITGTWTATVKLQRSDDAGVTWNDLASYTTNQAGVSVATTKTACLIRATVSAYTSGTAVVTVDGTTGAAPTLSVAISTANVSQAIQCGQNWSVITTGTWTGKLRIEISTDGGANWNLVQALQGASSNFNTAGQTGASQCLLRVSSDFTQAFSGTATVSLTSSSFNWVGIVKVTAVASATSATANVLNKSNQDKTGLSTATATWQWSEGSWSTFRGWPSCLTFFQERLFFASTKSEPATGWGTKNSSFTDFGVSSPIVDSDSVSFVIPSLKLNAIQSLVVMPTAMLALTSDSEWSIAPGSNGSVGPISGIVQNYQGSRGSSSLDPVVLGTELLMVQPMGTTVRNLIFQLAVNGFLGENVSLISQHLFTGFQINAWAYQQEPGSVVWAVRSDGLLLSLTYMREQEVQAWTWHDTQGTFESVAVIPNSTLNINEVWFVVNRTINGVQTRFIERMVPRDASTDPAQQFFVDCGLTYSGAAATVISGLTHLAGANVSVLADGNVISGLTVSAQGTIALAIAASTVHVGLPYVSDVETLKIEAPDQRGTLQARRVTIPRVTMRFWNSRGGYIGTVRPSDDSTTGLDPILQRDVSDNLNAAIALKTQDYGPLVPPGGYSQDAHLIYRQVDPLPFALLAFIPQIVAGEN